MCCGKSVSPKRVTATPATPVTPLSAVAPGRLPLRGPVPLAAAAGVGPLSAVRPAALVPQTVRGRAAGVPPVGRVRVASSGRCPVCRRPLSTVNVGGVVKQQCRNPNCRYEL